MSEELKPCKCGAKVEIVSRNSWRITMAKKTPRIPSYEEIVGKEPDPEQSQSQLKNFHIPLPIQDAFTSQPEQELVEALEEICAVNSADGYAKVIDIANKALGEYKGVK